ncbi:helix-turn-helix domain-containing protein [Amycolatopsis cynarae]|uniref:Helix-turn-helix domain-containing protein n=1 Tax=Amycolatopsis cynarae TaxID=2995223 RepID=A0ABY7BBE6_9PSEU|nr:helix-turn-helix domain-containing protein [Amycolatopsis sp. HUAS 11-8]WAL68458.1 helix-turn-helix domain-containing protein [Amycolatopsis sp. HUAS 11-8]
MSQQYYSVEQVAELLDLHVRTVRGYVRDGKLKATRIGKQYRIRREDLEAFTGTEAPAPVRRTRHAEASVIVQIDAISRETTDRLSTLLMAATAHHRQDGENLRIQTAYDEERASLKVIILGGLENSAELLQTISSLVEDGG